MNSWAIILILIGIAVLCCMAYFYRDGLKAYFKKNKKKILAAGSGLAIISAGSGVLFAPEGYRPNTTTLITNSNGRWWYFDGVADDVQIQAAIDDAGTSGDVYVGSDVSLDSELSLTNDNCHVYFQGHKATLTTDIAFVNVTSCRHSSVSNVKVQVTDGHTASILLLYFPDNGLWADRIRHCKFSDWEIYNPSASNVEHNYTGIHLFIDSDNDNPADLGNIVDCRFTDFYIDGCYNGILLECCDTDAYGNGNYFENIYLDQYVVGVNFSVHAGATTGYDHNVFEKVGIQSAVWTEYGLKSIQGQGNHFENLMIWDWYVCSDEEGSGSAVWEIEVSSAAEDTEIDAHYLYNDGSGVDYSDSGTDTELQVSHLSRMSKLYNKLVRNSNGNYLPYTEAGVLISVSQGGITTLPTGEVVLSSDLDMLPGSELRGQGNSTVLNFVSACIQISDDDDFIVIRDLCITGTGLDCGGDWSCGMINIKTTIGGSLGNITVENVNMFTYSQTGSGISISGQNGTLSNITMKNCNFYNSTSHGIRLCAIATYTTLFDNILVDNCKAFECGKYTRTHDWICGFVIDSSATTTCRNVWFERCTAYRNWESGFHIETAGTFENTGFRRCTSLYNGIDKPAPTYATGFMATTNCSVIDCFAKGNDLNGVKVIGSYATVENCRIIGDGNTNNGVLFSSTHELTSVDVIGNTISGVAYGIYLSEASYCDITHNTIYNISTTGIHGVHSAIVSNNNTLSYNDINMTGSVGGYGILIPGDYQYVIEAKIKNPVTGIHLAGDHCEISGGDITGASSDAIFLANTGGGTYQVVDDVNIINTGDEAIALRGTNTTISKCNIIYCGRGISGFGDINDLNAIDNTVCNTTGGAGYGIYTDTGKRLYASGNCISETHTYALVPGDNSIVTGNFVSYAYYSGIYLAGKENCSISNNQCWNNGVSGTNAYGIYLVNANNNSVGNNVCHDQVDGIYIAANCFDTVILGNVCKGNSAEGIDNDGTRTIPAVLASYNLM
jgi:parallel beta-helix repeat protein